MATNLGRSGFELGAADTWQANNSTGGMMQPKPIRNDSTPIFRMVLDDIKDRAVSGKLQYGTFLQANNGRSPLQDLYEELLDACMYIRQAIEEGKDGN